ncbi:MAG TPA: prolyl oligopeptidase family serine peptidase, partial [Burkholderiales bacterium]|nr:prolyl oligopeptidase family serine peptidase [Burkholderiales bacterium]
DGRYLVITITKGTDPKRRVYYRDLADAAGKVIPLLDDFDADYDFIANDGSVFFFKTDLEAPRSRVIAIDITKPGRANWREIISQSDDALRGVNFVNAQFICNYLHDAHSRVDILAWDGKTPRAKPVREVELAGIGSAGGFGGKRADSETFYSFTSFTTPSTIYRLDLVTGKSSVFRQPKVDFDSAAYETKQVFIRSKDGTRVPMFITHRRGVKLDGTNPTLLYGYGGFNAPITPAFDIERLVWMEMGGVYAVANLRGGGEYGAPWHLAGTKGNKQNVFDDFIAAAEWLIANGYTSSAKLAIQGRSNGGLLVGAALTQRPELFGAALPVVGVLDMLRFHKFTIGWAWTSDYGSADDPAQFDALLKYSPY